MTLDVEKTSTPERTIINLGPSHPAMHGTIRVVVETEGELITDCDVQVGYLHRGFEKSCEDVTWHQCIPYVDRLNYCSPLINNFAFVGALEKLAGITITERCKVLRTLLSELSRVTDHLTSIAAGAMELGAMTAFLYCIESREYMYEHICKLTGARVTVSYSRIGGMASDLPQGWIERLKEILKMHKELVARYTDLMMNNRIFIDRTRGIGIISKELALNYGFTGPVLRSTGVALDCRRYDPYLVYDKLNFEIPVGKYGDNYDRFYVRVRELEESVKMIEQLMDNIPAGPLNVDAPQIMLPPKEEVYKSIEGIIKHFKIIYEGPRIPAGEVYGAAEGANGELGFYLVSDGSGKPLKCRVRPPCFILMGGLHNMLKGYTIADVVPTFGSINMIGGECDR
jgi:NADH-quinone oxidoreductase subunit D